MCFFRKKKTIKTKSTPSILEDQNRLYHNAGRNPRGGNKPMNPSRDWRGLTK